MNRATLIAAHLDSLGDEIGYPVHVDQFHDQPGAMMGPRYLIHGEFMRDTRHWVWSFARVCKVEKEKRFKQKAARRHMDIGSRKQSKRKDREGGRKKDGFRHGWN
jgi:hypothetical protein